MEVFRMHAGISAETIVKTMNRYICLAEKCQTNNKRLWIFFDEFNTTINIGLLKEIICERTLLGRSLPENIVFLGACNPLRQKTSKLEQNDDAHIGLRKNRYEMQKLLHSSTDRSLLYTVVPIPETMLEYIWDYGHLNESSERTYIETMLNECQHLSTHSLLFKLTVDLLVESQKYFRDFEDVSSVSLRDIARFCRLYNWFYESLQERENKSIHRQQTALFILRSSFIAVLLCYYFRLRSNDLQKAYLDRMTSIMSKYYPTIGKTPGHLKKFLEKEQKLLLKDRLELPAGTAYNRALRDNLFVLFACILNRIPVFLCGKPGSSKSSAVQIILSNLKGKKCRDPYFQTLPELIPVTFQGSQNSTSESIVKIFERADRYSQVKNCSGLLPVIIFDEIGLAELSPHNPLKVLHAELEIEKNRYGFVGLSNWRLDASKMNRALYVSVPDPSIEDLQKTGQTIDQFSSIDRNIINCLSRAYHELYQYLKENYFGLRDYYSLIKNLVRETNENENIFDIIQKQLKVNFDGPTDASEYLWHKFCEYMQRKDLIDIDNYPMFNHLLEQALNNRTGRYLMLIAENESTIDYVERFIHIHQQTNQINVRTLVGSSFSGDFISSNTYTEQYNYRVLMDIILYAETKMTLIMRQMGHLYDSLYDLFNQNFSVFAKKKYCRIALGAIYHPRCLINDDFYCVVFINKRDLDKCDPPFLNRFEKHLIDIRALIQPHHLTMTNQLQDWIDSLLPKDFNGYFPLQQHLFVNYSQDYLCSLVLEAFERTSTVLNYCQTKLLRTSSFDLPLLLSLDSNSSNQSLIDRYYDIHSSLTFSQLLQHDKNPIRIIYTYTQLFDRLNDLPTDVIEINLSSFKTQRDLTDRIKEFAQHRLLLIRVDYHAEQRHLLSLKYILLNEIKSKIWLIFHLQRNLLNQTDNDVLFHDWPTDMIDDLNTTTIFPRDLIENPSYSNFECTPNMFDELIDRCLAKFRYVTSWHDDEMKINQRRTQIFVQLTTNLRSIIEKQTKLFVQQNLLVKSDWRRDLLTNSRAIGTARSFTDAFHSTIFIYYSAYFTLLLTHFERHNFIDSSIYLTNLTDEVLREYLVQLWTHCFETSLDNLDTTIVQQDIIEMPLVFDLKLPCAQLEYENIRKEQSMFESIYHEDFFFNQQIFPIYFHDQLRLHLLDAKIHLSSSFAFELLTSNRTRTCQQYKQLFLIDHIELTTILRVFEISLQLLNNEQTILSLIQQQFLIEPEQNIRSSSFYTLVLFNQQFYQLPPNTTVIDAQWLFTCKGDPMIETSLMNLIELILSFDVINRTEDIQQIVTVFSSIASRIHSLQLYWVSNLEKLRTYLSLVRCLTSTLPSNEALSTLKTVCRNGFVGRFESCFDIDEFIDNIRHRIVPIVARETLERMLIKLEDDFLKDWLVGHIDSYGDVLKLINRSTNNLWFYSAKILTLIDVKLKLFERLQDNDENENYPQLNEILRNDTNKLQRLLVNRFHMKLMLNVDDQQIDVELVEKFKNFRENLSTMNNFENLSASHLICLIVWLKYYSQMYAFALNNDMNSYALVRIDEILTNTDSKLCSTLKLFIIKQLLQMSQLDLQQLYTLYNDRQVFWMKNFIDQQTETIVEHVVLPTPLFECFDEFKRIDRILKSNNELKQFILDCHSNPRQTYAFLSWFIHYYYSRFNNIDEKFLDLITNDLRSELTHSFTSLGHRFLVSLCSNFTPESYFHLTSTEDIHQRLLALNITALFISFRFQPYFGRILFDVDRQIPMNMSQHLSSIVLPGLATHPAINQMIDLRREKRGKSIYKCSATCLWMFDSLDNRKTCPLCKKPFNRIKKSMKFIDQYLEEFNRTQRLGYYHCQTFETNQPISFRFLRFLLHGLLLFLQDSNYLTENDFKQQFLNDYKILSQLSTDPQQTYIWLYKLLNHLLDERILNSTSTSVCEIEMLIERQLISPHIESIDNEINEYKTAFAHFMKQQNPHGLFQHFLDETFEDEQRYPLLNFFNVTRFHTSNLLDEFILKIRTFPSAERIYPLTTFIVNHLDEYSNIQYLLPMVTFSNYLIDKFNHRIQRIDAAEMKIQYYLTHSSDDETINQLYQNFLHSWHALNFESEDMNVGMFLLNTTKDETSQLFATRLKNLADLQNQLVEHFHYQPRHVALQSIRTDHLFRFDRDEFSSLLVNECTVINYEYGKSKDIIYDYDEIEMILRKLISSLVRIDTDKLKFANYQFELYGENSSLITDVRSRIKQERLPVLIQSKIVKLISQMKNDELLNYLGSLYYIFTYLRTSVKEKLSQQMTIERFVMTNIPVHHSLSENVLHRTDLSDIQLRFIIDLYELLEENIFDRVRGAYIKKPLTEETYTNNERSSIIDKFSRATFDNQGIAVRLKSIDCWISMFKRLIVRVVNANIVLDVPLQVYLQRTDFWTDQIADGDLRTFQIDETILLQHAYVILLGLQRKKQGEKNKIQIIEEQQKKPRAWYNQPKTSDNKLKISTAGFRGN